IPAGIGADHARTGTRDVYFEAWTPADIYDRGRLGAGDVIVGPAILEEFGSTIPVHPGFTAAVDPYGNVLLSREAQ
ncbi:MAG TPA: hypothetical protein VIQ02_03935, partial [Jiangellaceae bacterium]